MKSNGKSAMIAALVAVCLNSCSQPPSYRSFMGRDQAYYGTIADACDRVLATTPAEHQLQLGTSLPYAFIEVPSELRAGLGRARGEQASAQVRWWARSRTRVERVPTTLNTYSLPSVVASYLRPSDPGNTFLTLRDPNLLHSWPAPRDSASSTCFLGQRS